MDNWLKVVENACFLWKNGSDFAGAKILGNPHIGEVPPAILYMGVEVVAAIVTAESLHKANESFSKEVHSHLISASDR
ncbi:MAG TPA: hypothetical protein VF177_07195 [Anaerolineae bacterium]